MRSLLSLLHIIEQDGLTKCGFEEFEDLASDGLREQRELVALRILNTLGRLGLQ